MHGHRSSSFGDTEHLVCRCLEVTCLALLALLAAEENEVNHFGIEFPGRSEVYLDIASCYIQSMTMVHTESNLIQIGITVILGNCSPCMTKSIITVVILLLHSHIGTYLSDSNVYVGIETVRLL